MCMIRMHNNDGASFSSCAIIVVVLDFYLCSELGERAKVGSSHFDFSLGSMPYLFILALKPLVDNTHNMPK